MSKAEKKMLEEYICCILHAGCSVLGFIGTIREYFFDRRGCAIAFAFLTGANVIHYTVRKKRFNILLSQLDFNDITEVIFDKD